MTDQKIIEAVEEFLRLDLVPNPHDVAMHLIDAAYASGEIGEDEIDLAASDYISRVERELARRKEVS